MTGPQNAGDDDDRLDVLVVGDANPDLLLTGDVVPRFGQAEQILESAELVLGGSAGIVAVGLARLGARTGLAAVVGADEFGQFVRDRLEERGVDTTRVHARDDAATGLSVILSLEDDRSILTRPGTIPLLTAEAVAEAVDDLRPRHVHVASYFLQPALAAELLTVVTRLRGDGITVSLDTNWDPAERWAGMEPLLEVISLLLPNREEVLALASAVSGHEMLSVDDAGKLLSSRGCRVIVKAGAQGGISFEGGERAAQAPGLIVDVVDTTGAGDSFDAGYLAAMLNGIHDEEERLRWAAVSGSLSVRGAGGTAAQATLGELREHLRRQSLHGSTGTTEEAESSIR